jgi:uncharacterized protein YlxW (UPF0749 family)
MNAVLKRKVEVEDSGMASNEEGGVLGKLRSDVDHLQSDVTDIKAEIRGLAQRIDQGFSRIEERIEKIKDSLHSAKMWAFGLYVTLGSALLAVIAKGFKWI